MTATLLKHVAVKILDSKEIVQSTRVNDLKFVDDVEITEKSNEKQQDTPSS